MTRIPYPYRPVPLALAAMVALVVTLIIPKPLNAQPAQSSTADTTIGSEIPSSDNEPQHAQPAPAPDKSSIDSATDVEIRRLFHELKSELLDDRHEFLDKRAKDVDWWLAAIVVFLTLIAVFLAFFAIVVAIISYFGFQRFREIEARAEKHAEEAERVVEQIKARRDEADSLLKDMTAETVRNEPDKASEAVETVQQSPVASPIDRAIAAAISFQQQGEIEQAIEKWRSIANVVEGVDSQLQARAWFSVGYLYGEEENWEAAIDAYDKAIRLKPDYAIAYNNRGVAKKKLDQPEAALADYDKALELDPYRAAVYYNRGIAKYDLGQPKAALADLNEAIRLDPGLADAYNNRGVAKYALDQPNEALADYNEAIRLRPDMANAYNNRGNAKKTLGRLNEAREDYQRALALAQESGDEDLIAIVQDNLSQLDNE